MTGVFGGGDVLGEAVVGVGAVEVDGRPFVIDGRLKGGTSHAWVVFGLTEVTGGGLAGDSDTFTAITARIRADKLAKSARSELTCCHCGSLGLLRQPRTRNIR